MVRTVAIIQARMSSTRLPGKVLHEIAGRSMIEWVVTRVLRAGQLDEVVVATSRDAGDDVLAEHCAHLGAPCFRGSLEDVLDRYYEAAQAYRADIVVRVTADCPFVDPRVIDEIVAAFNDQACDYAANVDPPSFPHGLDAEVFSMGTLRRAWQEARWRSEREHVTPYVRNHPERFRLVNIVAPWDLSAHRWTVDEPADLEFVRQVAGRLDRIDFDYSAVLDLLARHPELREINSGIERDAGMKYSVEHDEVVR